MSSARRNLATANDVTPVRWTLDEALAFVRSQNLMLVYASGLQGETTIEVHSGTRKIPIGVRRAVHKHQADVLHLLATGDVQTCANPGLHRKYWRKNRKNAMQWCAICKQLDALCRIDEALQAA